MLLIQDERYKHLGHFATQNFFKFIFTSTLKLEANHWKQRATKSDHESLTSREFTTTTWKHANSAKHYNTRHKDKQRPRSESPHITE